MACPIPHHVPGTSAGRSREMTIMAEAKGNLFTRDDTFFGVCEGLGEDLRIPANLLRLAFAVGLFFSPLGSLAAYLGLGLVVLVTRLLLPARPRRATKVAAAPAEPIGANDSAEFKLAA